MYKIYYTWGYSELLHNDGFHMDHCDTCSLSIQEKQHRVFMFVSVDDKWGDRTVEYDEGFYCSRECLMQQVQQVGIYGPDDNTLYEFAKTTELTAWSD